MMMVCAAAEVKRLGGGGEGQIEELVRSLRLQKDKESKNQYEAQESLEARLLFSVVETTWHRMNETQGSQPSPHRLECFLFCFFYSGAFSVRFGLSTKPVHFFRTLQPEFLGGKKG